MEFAGPRRVVWTSCNISVCTPQKAKSKVNSDMDYSASKMGLSVDGTFVLSVL